MIINWAIEARKWQILVRAVQHVSFYTAAKAVLSGVSLSLVIPNGFGDYAGRAVYMDEGKRLRSLSVTFAGGTSQLVVTLIAGVVALVYLKNYVWNMEALRGLSVFWINSMITMIAIGSVCMLFIYYKLSLITRLAEKIPFVYKYKYLIEGLESFHRKELTRILCLSVVRYIVFVVQYLLMLHIFSVNIFWPDAIATTSVLFFSACYIAYNSRSRPGHTRRSRKTTFWIAKRQYAGHSIYGCGYMAIKSYNTCSCRNFVYLEHKIIQK